MSAPPYDATSRLTAIVQSSHDAIMSTDLRGTITSWNRSAETVFGYSPIEAVGQSIRLIIPPELYAAEDELLQRIRAGRVVDHYETIRVRKDGSRLNMSLTVSPILAADGTIVGASKIARDVTAHNHLERDAMRLAAIVDSSHDAIISKDLDGVVQSWNRAAATMFGFSASEMVGKSDRRIVPERRQRYEADVLSRVRRGEQVETRDTECRRKNGTVIPVAMTVSPIRSLQGDVVGASTIFRDMSGQKKAEKEALAMSLRMSHLASHDPLTDLPNRLLMRDRLGHAIALAKRHQRRLAVLFLDLDGFKYVNDSLGHILGDDLLRAVGRDVTSCVRSSDTVSRHSGDEFVVVLSELERAEDAAASAQKIIDTLARPHAIGSHQLHVAVSIGISVYPDDGEDGETLLKSADIALYHAKNQGRDCFQFFKPHLKVRVVERQSIEADLRRAVGGRQFELLYQPKFNLEAATLVGAEALIRWRHPSRGLVEPVQFVAIAEDSGLIRPIGRWVVHEACRQAQAWQDAGLRPIPVSVNISAGEFRSQGFLQGIVDSLQKTRLDPYLLEIELTESALMAHVEDSNSVLRSLKALGVRLAVDDFGTGWSSLSYLRHFPLDVLKIDKSFLREVTPGSLTAPIVSAVIGIGKSLNLRVIAEGVETREQLTFLQAERCSEGQGFYLGRPLAAQDFARMLSLPRPMSSNSATPSNRLGRLRRAGLTG